MPAFLFACLYTFYLFNYPSTLTGMGNVGKGLKVGHPEQEIWRAVKPHLFPHLVTVEFKV